MKLVIWAASAAIAALTLASALLNGWGWMETAIIMVVLAISSEVLGAVFALFLATTSSGEWARRFTLALLLIGCMAFNGWSGFRAMDMLNLHDVAEHRPVADVERDLGRITGRLSTMEAVDLSVIDSVKAAQRTLAFDGFYSGVIDGLPGPATSAALAAAGVSYRADRARLEAEFGTARDAASTEQFANAIHTVVVLLIEAMKGLGLWAIGVHKAGARLPTNVTDIKPYLRNGKLVSRHQRARRGAIGSKAA